MDKTKCLTEGQKKLINFNKYILLRFLTSEKEEITISSLSKEVGLSYRAVYKRILKLREGKIIIAKKDNERRGKPVILEINPKYKSEINIRFSLGAKTPKEEEEEKKIWLSEFNTYTIIEAIKKAGKPLNYSEIDRIVKGKMDQDLDPSEYFERLDKYELIDTRYHITRKGSAYLKKTKKSKLKSYEELYKDEEMTPEILAKIKNYKELSGKKKLDIQKDLKEIQKKIEEMEKSTKEIKEVISKSVKETQELKTE